MINPNWENSRLLDKLFIPKSLKISRKLMVADLFFLGIIDQYFVLVFDKYYFLSQAFPNLA